MKFSFNPEADIEAELIDRCIEHDYVVEVHLSLGGSPRDYVIRERIDGLMTLKVQAWSDTDVDTATGPITEIGTSDIDLLYIH